MFTQYGAFLPSPIKTRTCHTKSKRITPFLLSDSSLVAFYYTFFYCKRANKDHSKVSATSDTRKITEKHVRMGKHRYIVLGTRKISTTDLEQLCTESSTVLRWGLVEWMGQFKIKWINDRIGRLHCLLILFSLAVVIVVVIVMMMIV